MAHYDIHIIPHGDHWAVIREGDDVPISIHASQAEAEQVGRDLAADGAVEFSLHNRDRTEDDDPRLSGR